MSGERTGGFRPPENPLSGGEETVMQTLIDFDMRNPRRQALGNGPVDLSETPGERVRTACGFHLPAQPLR